MRQQQKFFICKHCGNLVSLVYSAGVKMICCGEEMTELIPNTVEASAEKHLPVIKVNGNTITVEIGSAPHPMLQEHSILWVYLLTERGGQRKTLQPGDSPSVSFALTDDDKVISAYAYCNIHGLWKTDL